MFGNFGNVDLIRQGLRHLNENEAKLIARRWGLGGEPPRSIAELAREAGVAPIEMARRLRALEAKLLQAMSQSPAAGMGFPAAGRGRASGTTAGPAAAGQPAAGSGESSPAVTRTPETAPQEREDPKS
ncbi:MAG TPA: hypothetical protein VIK92_01375 [Thermaerobacter sp.]